jgi:hypothetical protein
MEAKHNNGRCTPRSKRIIFLVDIGVRATNNWPTSYIVDLKRSGSVKEQVQTLGRGSRLPARLQKLQNHDLFVRFCHPRWYFPQESQDDTGSKVKDAWEFVTTADSGQIDT